MSTTNQANQRETIENYNLTRAVLIYSRSQIQPFRDVIDPNSQAAWFSGSVIQPPSSDGRRPGFTICSYSICPEHHAYVTQNAQLTFAEEEGSLRRTNMRHRDMIVDNFLATGGDLTKLTWLGAAQIINLYARDAIKMTFTALNVDIGTTGTAELPASHPRFTELTRASPLVQGIISLCNKYAKETGHAKVKRVIYMTEGWRTTAYVANTDTPYAQAASAGPPVTPPRSGPNLQFRPNTSFSFYNPTLHMMVELFRPGDEGYPAETAETHGAEDKSEENKPEDQNPDDEQKQDGDEQDDQKPEDQTHEDQTQDGQTQEKKKKKRYRKNKNKNK
ncbi:hypothetical protein F5Y16DRAFT_415453 [Xylariaceae sp. FL0255]|nr:hypothetical protein F5Y16DRAFT_415453 [Xylariaceae sp. FL0255]